MVAVEPFVVRIPSDMYKEMVAHIEAEYPNEACGLLASKDGQIFKNYATANSAEHPIDEYDGEMYSYYHSHPKSEAYPSSRDKEWAKRNKLYYIIFSHQYFPATPYARVFSVHDDETVIEGKIEAV